VVDEVLVLVEAAKVAARRARRFRKLREYEWHSNRLGTWYGNPKTAEESGERDVSGDRQCSSNPDRRLRSPEDADASSQRQGGSGPPELLG